MGSAEIGRRIRELRERRGINRNQMARALGTSWQHVDRWEAGRTTPSATSLAKIASFLGVRVDALLNDRSDSDRPGLEDFLRTFAPNDLTDAELAWLRGAPLPPDASAGRYADLLQTLRAGASPVLTVGESGDRTPPARSGTQKRVDRGEVLARAKTADEGASD